MKNELRIAICDDEKIMTDVIERELEQLLQVIEVTNYHLDTYHSGMELLQSGKDYHLVFLDIEMPEIDGFSLAEKLNRLKKKPMIIFLTNHRDLAAKGYYVSAFRYLTKPLEMELFQEAVSSSVKKLISFHKIIVKSKGKEMIVDVNEMTHIEADGTGGCYFYIGDKFFNKEESLKYWEKTLPEGMFVKTHKSYLVNLRHIKQINDKKVLCLSSGKEIPLAAREYKKVNNAFHEFIRIQGRG